MKGLKERGWEGLKERGWEGSTSARGGGLRRCIRNVEADIGRRVFLLIVVWDTLGDGHFSSA